MRHGAWGMGHGAYGMAWQDMTRTGQTRTVQDSAEGVGRRGEGVIGTWTTAETERARRYKVPTLVLRLVL